MTNVNKIRFDFCARDEAFVRNLYVGWDSFYRDSFDAVVDEYLSRHNEDGRLLRFDKLQLNLGNIPQEDFYLQFPVRLREELERVFPFQSAQAGVRESFSEQLKRRMNCLRFYLEKGFCPTEWEDAEFELEKEIRFLLPYASTSMAHLFHESIRRPNQLYRMKWNLPNDLFGHLMLLWLEDKTILQKEKEQRYEELRNIDTTLEPSLYKVLDSIPFLSEKLSALLSKVNSVDSMSWLLSTTVSVYEKRRILSGLLEWEPIVVIRYIHETQDEKNIRSLAVLLDKVMVRQIINAECEDHTEADVPTYWMYLYTWLLKYYPFNGIYMFGNKLQFQEYLNMKLLQFIRKRSYSAFLSKVDITIYFLIEVFGQVYYLEVLNIIYNQQARNEDGSPVYTDYLNMELYYMFLHLSLLKIPVQTGESPEGWASLNQGAGEEAYSYDVQALHAWLANKRISSTEKQTFLSMLVKERPFLLIRVLEGQYENQPLLAEWMGQTLVYELLSTVSFYATELFIKLADYLHSASDKISWLSGITTGHLSFFIRIVLLRWIGLHKSTATDSKESVTLFLQMLYKEVSGSPYGNMPSDKGKEEKIKETIQQVSKPLSLANEQETIIVMSSLSVVATEKDTTPVPEWTLRLRVLLKNNTVGDIEKQRALARLFDHFRNHCEQFISILREQSLLKSYIQLMDDVLFEQLVRELARKNSEMQSVTLCSFYRWVFANSKRFSAYFSGNVEKMREKAIILLAHWAINGSVKDRKTSEIAKLFLTGLFGAGNVTGILQLIYQELANGLSDNGNRDEAAVSEDLLALFIRMSHSLKETSSDIFPEKEELSTTGLLASVAEEQDKRANKEIENEAVSSSMLKENTTNSEWQWHEEELAEWLRNPNVSIHTKRSVLQKYIIWQPERIAVFMYRLISKQVILTDEWINWLDEDDLIHMIAGISLSKAELLEQIIVYLQQKHLVTDSSLRRGIIQYLAGKELANWVRETSSETAKRFISFIYQPDVKNDGQTIQQSSSIEDIIPIVIDELLIKDMEDNMEEQKLMNEPEQINIHNAGLALLSPWFPRLFNMLNLLTEDRREFKDMEARIRAIFILQRLVTSDDKEYKESELGFNRILVNCPFHEPLPTKMELSEHEIETIESLLNGVKGYWTKVQNVSIKGLQHNFIERSGRLEQKDGYWFLTVDPRSYDMLLDSVPWAYNRIAFSWLPFHIRVSWRSKQEF